MRIAFLSMLLLLPRAPATSLADALRGTAASGVVLAVRSGQQIATQGDGALLRAPGSILKPLFLAAALEAREVLPGTSVFCRRSLLIEDGGQQWNLACTHPQSQSPFSAREALAYSCNRYFAELADRIPPSEVGSILRRYGLPAPNRPLNREGKELLVLGVAHIQVSPMQMAIAYRRLALELDAGQSPSLLDAVRDGLRDSVTYGMAHHAAVSSMDLLGKTGTADDRGRSHGWFAGIGRLRGEQVVVVIYLPNGSGADAASLAQRFFLASAHQP